MGFSNTLSFVSPVSMFLCLRFFLSRAAQLFKNRICIKMLFLSVHRHPDSGTRLPWRRATRASSLVRLRLCLSRGVFWPMAPVTAPPPVPSPPALLQALLYLSFLWHSLLTIPCFFGGLRSFVPAGFSSWPSDYFLSFVSSSTVP